MMEAVVAVAAVGCALGLAKAAIREVRAIGAGARTALDAAGRE